MEGFVFLLAVLLNFAMIAAVAYHAYEEGRLWWAWGIAVFFFGIWAVAAYLLWLFMDA